MLAREAEIVITREGWRVGWHFQRNKVKTHTELKSLQHQTTNNSQISEASKEGVKERNIKNFN